MDSWKHFIHWCQQPTMIKFRLGNPGHVFRVKLSSGAKVGAVSGVISGAVFSPLFLFVGHFWGWFFRLRFLDPELDMIRPFEDWVADTFLSPYFLSFTIPSIIFGVILGLLFGSLFIVLYDKLPGKTPTMKGIVTAIILWAAGYLGFPFLVYPIMWGDWQGSISYFTNINHGWPVITVGLGTSLLWGWLLGRFWTSDQLGKH